MTGHNICFKGVMWKIIPKLSLLPLLILEHWMTNFGIYYIIFIVHVYNVCECFICETVIYVLLLKLDS